MGDTDDLCPRLDFFSRDEQIDVLVEGWTKWLVEKYYGSGPGRLVNRDLMKRLNQELDQESIGSVVLDSLLDVLENAREEFLERAESMISHKLHMTLAVDTPIYTRINPPFRTKLSFETPTDFEMEFTITDGLEQEEHDWIVENLPGPVVDEAPDEEFRE